MISAQDMHDAVDKALDLIADDLYDLPHNYPGSVDQLAAQILAHMVAFHVEQATNPAEFLERLRRGQHELVDATETQT